MSSPAEERVYAAVSAELKHIWSDIQAEMARAVDESTYRIWLEPMRARELTGERLLIEASPQACGWIADRFGGLLQAATTAVLGPDIAAQVTGTPGAADSQSAKQTSSRGSRRAPRAADTGEPAMTPGEDDLLENPKLTFDQFVIGDSNRLAHAAALAVAELPGQAYNPLFICGPTGVGKTHLLRAIASLVLAHNPGLTVRASTGEVFTNEFQMALTEGHMDRFKQSFRRLDVLLIDDVQFFERKTRTEEEFFHTFNSLYESGGQIVLTSDRPPRDLQALEDRLRERFEAGLVADISPPDYNTRLAILRKRANHDRIAIADERALETIAEHVTVNVRALEGALIRVVAFSSLTGRPIDVDLAAEVLNGLYPKPMPVASSIAEIQRAACTRFGLSSQEMLSSARSARVAWPRQVAMYLSRELTGESLPAIGRQFGGRDHTTVLHAWRKTEQKISADAASRQAVDEVRRLLERKSPDRAD